MGEPCQDVRVDSPLTDQELDVIESRCSATTPAPWTSYWEGRDMYGDASFIMQHLDGQQRDLYLTFDYSPRQEARNPADQYFIAHAREDPPRVLAEDRRLKQLVTSRGLPREEV
jgi:hypothetical protein